jgi:hypothetical protein
MELFSLHRSSARCETSQRENHCGASIEILQMQGVRGRSTSELDKCRRDNTSESVVEARNSFLERIEDQVFVDLENLLSWHREKS